MYFIATFHVNLGVNLGVYQENPSMINGTIKILENLHQYVPKSGDNGFKLLCYGDGLLC